MRQLAYAQIMREFGVDIWPAILLERIHFWSKHAKAILHGQPYVVRTFEEWNEETGITPHIYKRAMAVLRERGLIETEVHPHPFKAGVLRATFLRLTALSIETFATFRKEQSGPFEKAVSDVSSYKNNKTSGKLQPEPSSPDQPKGEELKKIDKKDHPKTLDELQAMMTTPQKIPKKVGTGADLECLWKAGLVKYHQGTFFGSFTRAHKAFAKQLVEKIPKAEIPVVIDKVLADWPSFREYVRKNSTAFKIADNPDLLTVLKFSDHAVNFARGESPAINCNKPVAGSDLDW
jgi:DNA-binding MarR family transcriptional regulator